MNHAILSVAAITVALVFVLTHYSVGDPDWLPRCLSRGLVAVESATSAQELSEIWKQPAFKRMNLVPGLYWDFGFMGAYGLQFVLLGVVACRRSRMLGRAVLIAGGLAILTTLATVAFDARENLTTLNSVPALLDGKLPDEGNVASTRFASLAKWGLSGVTLLLLYGSAWPSRAGSAMYRVIAWGVVFFLVLSGLSGVLGVFDNTKLEALFTLFFPALVGIVVIALRYWDVHMGLAQEKPRATRDVGAVS
jgi:hypothetical protein